MSTVSTTFRLNLNYLESNPHKNNFEDIGIQSVLFEYKVAGTLNTFTVSGARSGNFFIATVELAPNTEYEVRSKVTNTQGTVNSIFQTFETDDLTEYDNVQFTILKQEGEGGLGSTSAPLPVAGAELVITNPLGTDWTARSTTPRGLAWFQRIPRGTYAYTLTLPLYTPKAGTVNTGMVFSDGTHGTITFTDDDLLP